MIFVDRSVAPVPDVYASRRTQQERDRILREALSLQGSDSRSLSGRTLQKAQEGVLRARDAIGSRLQSELWKEARPALRTLFHDKCAYCESPLAGAGDIELYRPRANARSLDGSVDSLHYFWLALEWENTLIACALCNRGKGSRFPVEGQRAAFGETGKDALRAERPYLLNPCEDQPFEHLAVFSSGVLLPLSERGKYTIEVLNLNRKELIEERGRRWNAMQLTCEKLFGDGHLIEDSRAAAIALRALVRAKNPYAMAAQHGAFAFLSERKPELLADDAIRALFPDVGEARKEAAAQTVPKPEPTAKPVLPPEMQSGADVSVSSLLDEALAMRSPTVKAAKETYLDERVRQQAYSIESGEKEAREAYFTSAKRIERFTIRNFRAIEELTMEFPRPEAERESWLMLLGENGCGKSSILQALALTLMGEEHANSLGLDARRFVRRDPHVSAGEVIVEVSGVGTIRMDFDADSPQFHVRPRDPKVLLLAYGATRLLPKVVGRESSRRKAIRILNLFDPTAPLADTEQWLLDRDRVDDEQFESFCRDVSRLLMLPEDTRMYRDSGQVEMDYFGTRKALRDMSDGFQSIVALAGDIAIGVHDWWGGLRDAEGIVLLDEIEVHLHPTWKISIVERLRQTCPHLSFVVTTHDPLCLKGLRSEEIVVLRKTADRDVEVIRDIPRIDHLRADQLLGSFLFNLPSTRGSGTATAIARYSVLRGKPTRSDEEEREMLALKARLETELSSAITPEQRAVEDAVRAALSPAALAEAPADVVNFEVLRQLNDLLATEEAL